jgi:hypothetical protein
MLRWTSLAFPFANEGLMKRSVFAGLLLPLLALGLGWISNQAVSFSSWLSFMVLLLLASAILWLGWQAVKRLLQMDLPGQLAWVLIGAALLRLAAGVFWYAALPSWGYDNPVNNAGYVMADAHLRDPAAWKLAISSRPLLRAFSASQPGDQYGGLLFVSAAIYRYLGGQVHQPLLIVVVTAAFSALAVLFTWAFARLAWGERVAGWAAIGLTLFPEAVLLGSSQMREAFLVTYFSASFLGLVSYRQNHSWRGLAWMAGGVALSLPFSPPAALLLLGLLVFCWVALDYRQLVRQRWFGLALGGLFLLALAGVWLSWGRIAPPRVSNPIELVGWWLAQTARWQAHFTKTASPVVRKIFKWTPGWFHPLALIAYGVLQPFLPAALLDHNSLPLWQAIAIWRSLGWTVLLVFLIYALVRAWQTSPGRGLVLALSWVVWAEVLLAALRSGGDQWDNPRYRVMLAGPQAALAAWAWVQQQTRPSRWLWRLLVGTGIFGAWFAVWYLRRNAGQEWTVAGIFRTIGLGLGSTVLYWVLDRWRSRR